MSGHRSVLLTEAVQWLSVRSEGVYVDATCGLGGHTEALLEASAPHGRVVGIDRDPEALQRARERLADYRPRLHLVQGPFSKLQEHLSTLGLRGVDGLLADLGVSSIQLDQAHRGFSFRFEGPLDMRMGPDASHTVQAYLSETDEKSLSSVLARFGEVKAHRRVAQAILKARDAGRLTSTKALARVVEGAVPVGRPGRGGHVHPATQVFQALRIAVNHELEEVDALLAVLPQVVVPGGRAAIISFHSLEDRRVKRAFADPRPDPNLRHLPVEATRGPWEPVHRGVITPTAAELDLNPRARSAKLRVAQRRHES